MTSRTKGNKSAALLICAGSAAMMFVLSLPLFRNEIFLEHDIGAIFVPLRYFYAECLRAGESFLWIPNIFNGFYLQGEGQNGMTHPWHLLLYRFLPFTAAFDIELLSSYPFMFLGMIFFLRRWKLPVEAACFGAMLFTFSGYALASWLWLVHIGVMAHLPWLLLAIDIVMRSRNGKHVALASFAVVLLTASSLLISYPQITYIMGLAEGIYALFLLPAAARRWNIGLLFIAKVAGIVCAGVQVMPMLDLVTESTRAGADYEFQMAMSLHPYNLFCLVNPYLFHQRMYLGNGYQGLYGGAIMSLFVCWLLLRYKRLRVPKIWVLCFLIIAVLGALLTMGRYAYLYRLFVQLPVISSFRGPARHGVLFHIGWVMLATLAFAELIKLRTAAEKVDWKELRPLFLLPIISVALAIFVIILRLLPEPTGHLAFLNIEFAPTKNALLGAAIMVAGTACFIAAARGWPYGIPILILFVIADLGFYGLRHRTTGDFEEFRASIDVPDAGPEFRLEPDWLPVYSVNGPIMKGYSMVAGLVSLTPQRELVYTVRELPLRLAGAGWMRSRIGTNLELNRYAEQGIKWIELETPMPRARLLAHAQASSDPNKDIYEIDITTTALLKEALELDGGEPGTAQVTDDRPGVIHVTVDAPADRLLVLTEAYDNDWRITLDDSPETITPIPAYGDLLACVIPEGHHDLEFRFDPKSWRLGKTMTAWGLLLTLLYHAALWKFLPSRN